MSPSHLCAGVRPVNKHFIHMITYHYFYANETSPEVDERAMIRNQYSIFERLLVAVYASLSFLEGPYLSNNNDGLDSVISVALPTDKLRSS